MMFDIEMPEMEECPVGKVPDMDREKRRGPMAAENSENADALHDQQSTEDAIRTENGRLAHELVRLRAEGLIITHLERAYVVNEKRRRDRKPGREQELDELKTSSRESGLSNPMRVERRADGRYELVQGMRRLSA